MHCHCIMLHDGIHQASQHSYFSLQKWFRVSWHISAQRIIAFAIEFVKHVRLFVLEAAKHFTSFLFSPKVPDRSLPCQSLSQSHMSSRSNVLAVVVTRSCWWLLNSLWLSVDCSCLQLVILECFNCFNAILNNSEKNRERIKIKYSECLKSKLVWILDS